MAKPRGYWKEFSNVVLEAKKAARRLGDSGAMPTEKQLRKIGENSLAIAITKHGGFPEVAEMIGLVPNRTPNHFWEDETNVAIALHCIAHYYGSPGTMPTSMQLKKIQQHTLLQSISDHHGGMKKIASVARLTMSHDKKEDGFYESFEAVEHRVRDFIRRHGVPGEMPTHDKLCQRKESGLSAAIGKHGGYSVVAAHLGLKPGRRPNGYWDTKTILHELRLFISENGVAGVFPSGNTLRFFNAADLDNAINRNGGARKYADLLELPVSGGRENGFWANSDALKKEVFSHIEKHGTPGVMPTQADFKKHKRSDLNNAIYRHGGGHCHFAKLNNLKLTEKPKRYWQDLRNLRSELQEFNRYHGEPGVMPQQSQLREAGYSFLDSGITKYGGYFKVCEELGWSMLNVCLWPRSEIEIRIAHEIASVFDFDINDHKVQCGDRMLDCDMVLRKHSLVVEFDSWKWHSGNNGRGKDRFALDKQKAASLRSYGWRVIRLREKNLKVTDLSDLQISGNCFKAMCNSIICHIARHLGVNENSRGVARYLESSVPSGASKAKSFIEKMLATRSGRSRQAL